MSCVKNFGSIGNALPDSKLLRQLNESVRKDRSTEADLVGLLGEVDARRLYLEQACPSMFEFCVRVLRFAEGVAYKRIAVARAARRYPKILSALAEGRIHLTAACLIAPHLEDDSSVEWIEFACHATVREIKCRIVDRNPRPDVVTSIRRIATTPRATIPLDRVCVLEAFEPQIESDGTPALDSSCASEPTEPTVEGRDLIRLAASAERRRGQCEALGGGRFAIRFSVSDEIHAELQELRVLMRHSIPDGDVGKILTRAISDLGGRVRRQKFGSSQGRGSRRRASSSDHEVCEARETGAAIASTNKAGRPSRHIPVAIRRFVWSRDRGRCAFVSQNGRSCLSRERVEFHHQIPWARHPEHSVDNISLRCRAHNHFEAVLDFGPEKMDCFRRVAPK